MNAYERLGKLLDGKPLAKVRTGAGYSGAHVVEDDDGTRRVIVRENVVVVAKPDGSVTFDSCGWHTLTTGNAMRLAEPAVSSIAYRFHHGSTPFGVDGDRETFTLEVAPCT
jgi:hypothetical protein